MSTVSIRISIITDLYLPYLQLKFFIYMNYLHGMPICSIPSAILICLKILNTCRNLNFNLKHKFNGCSIKTQTLPEFTVEMSSLPPIYKQD